MRVKPKEILKVQSVACLWVVALFTIPAGITLVQAIQSLMQALDRLNPQAVPALTLMWLMPLPFLLGGILFAILGASFRAEADQLEARDPEGVRRDE